MGPEPQPDQPQARQVRRARRRLAAAVGIAAGAVVAVTVAPSGVLADPRDMADLRAATDDRTDAGTDAPTDAPTDTPTAPTGHDHSTHVHPERSASTPGTSDGHAHDHTDPATKNLISRSVPTGSLAADPTTESEVAANRAAVRARRHDHEPRLLPGEPAEPRRRVPEDRYAMAGGCYAIGVEGRWVERTDDGFAATARRSGAAVPLHFEPTDLGRYLLFDSAEAFLAARGGGPLPPLSGHDVVAAAEPGPAADWKVTGRDGRFAFRLPGTGQALAVDDRGRLVLAERPARFAIRRTSSCAVWPEIGTGVRGRPHRGETPFAAVRGYADAHTHGMAFEFLGGEVHCGRPWHRYGVTHALVDCEDHRLTAGKGAVLESFLSGDLDGHDPVGWPTFRDWPAPDSLTHEGTYYRWIERAWRGGLRLFVNLLVENNQLCRVYPLKRNSCDDMDSIRLQATRMKQLERYIDAQAGGPGEGWYRIVRNPFEARRVINQGKLAVVMGIETSVVFGCSIKGQVPQCNREEIDRQLDEVHRLGVRQMELVNKFDNALAGVAGDAGTTGVVVNGANFLETGSFWRMGSCPERYGEGVHDKEQYAVPREVSERDPLFGAIAKHYGPPVAVPVYPSAPHCNRRGLTELGEFTIRGLAERHMLFDPDHMSVRARKASLDLIERLGYPGILSSHSWSTPDAYPRISALGGFIAPYAGDSTGFVEKWRYHVGRADPRYLFGLGYGADINGLGAQGDPRGADAPDPVTYPFTGLGGVTVHRQRSGERVYDINVDGVAHYGLYPDWVEDLRRLAGDAIVTDLARGAEAYLRTWERAYGVASNSCLGGSRMRPVRDFRDLPRGATPRRVLMTVGQPDTRIGSAFTYCARAGSAARAERVRVRVVFDDQGRLERVRVV